MSLLIRTAVHVNGSGEQRSDHGNQQAGNEITVFGCACGNDWGMTGDSEFVAGRGTAE